MQRAPSHIVCLLLATLGLAAVSAGRAEAPDTAETRATGTRAQLKLAPAFSGVSLPVTVFRGAGWSRDEVMRIFDEASRIFARECRFTLSLETLRYIDVEPRLLTLDEPAQEALLARLAPLARPAVFFVNDTVSRDSAYAYLAETPSPSRATAWLTRRAPAACRGVLLAHEIGHVLLRAAKHSSRSDNLMHERCRHSNLAGQAAVAELDAGQCRILWERYAR